ncbi:MAG TPA: hypothetical protein VGG61_12475 [Gemmataceae bacterium]
MAPVETFTVSLTEVLDPRPKTKWEREYQAFRRLLPELLKTHMEKYVVIHEEQLIDSGDDDISLAVQFFAKYGNVSPHIGLVTETPPVCRIPHYRVFGKPGSPS